MTQPYISVVVACYNKQHIICECIRSVLRQSYQDYELIIVDDGSTDGSLNAMKKFRGNGRVKIISLQHRGVSAAKNAGFKEAKGKIVLFLDGDCILERNGLEELSKSFNNPEVGCVGGSLLALNSRSLLAKTIELMQNGVERKWPFGANVAYRKEVLEKTGGFDEQMDAGEDVDLFLRSQKLGFGYRFNPNLVARTINPHSLLFFFRQRLRWGRGFVQLYEKHRDVMTSKVKRCFILTAALIFSPLLTLADWSLLGVFLLMLAINYLRFIPLTVRLYRREYRFSLFLTVPLLKNINATAYLLSLIWLRLLSLLGKRRKLKPYIS